MLAVYSSGTFCSVALKTLKSEHEIIHPEPTGHSKILYSIYEQILSRSNIQHKDIHTIIVCIGPGSFTGIRCGLAFAQGVKLINPSTKLIGYSVNEILANKHNILKVIVSTRPQHYYKQEFDDSLVPKYQVCKTSEQSTFSTDDVSAIDIIKVGIKSHYDENFCIQPIYI